MSSLTSTSDFADEVELYKPEPAKRKRISINSNHELNDEYRDHFDSSDTDEVEGEIEDDIFEYVPRERNESIVIDNEARFADDAVEIEGEIDEALESYEESEGSPSPFQKTKRRKRSSIMSCDMLVDRKCCDKQCLTAPNGLTLSQMEKARYRFLEDCATYEKQRQYILDWFDDNQPSPGEFMYSIAGKVVCWQAWTTVLGITRRRFYLLKKKYNEGQRSALHGSTGSKKESLQREACRNFLQMFFTDCCDYMPNANCWHLPSSTKRIEVFDEMKNFLSSMQEPCCSFPLFCNIWDQDFSHVKIPAENRFGKCDVCCKLKDELKATRNLTVRSAILERRKGHHQFVRKERVSYKDRAWLAHSKPNQYISIAMDGMDTMKTELPFSKARYGTAIKAWHLKIHVVGLLIHGRHPLCMLDFHEYPHDTNLSLNSLLQAFWVHRDFLPDIVYLQLDNTSKENKNQFVFSFLAYLVETKVFEKIEISFLPVGHTHIDVDQLFSRVSVALKQRGCLTYSAFLALLRNCYTQSQGETTQEGARPQFARAPHQYAIREWILPHMYGLHGLNDSHHFIVQRNSDGKAELLCKTWCSAAWDPKIHKPLTLLKSIPEGIPELLKPDYKAIDINRLSTMVTKCTDVGVFGDAEKDDWLSFLEDEKERASSYADVDEIIYPEGSDGYKYHKTSLVYLKCVDDRWIVDDLRERNRDLPEIGEDHLCEVLRRSEVTERGEGLQTVYAGRYRPPDKRKGDVIEVDDHLSSIEKGSMVAIAMVGCTPPVLGQVLEIEDDEVRIAYWRGSWRKPWSPWIAGGHPWEDTIPRSSVMLVNFKFNDDGKLQAGTVKNLREHYVKLGLMKKK